jgi:NADH-ubiquinone oxidoreductase chain 5
MVTAGIFLIIKCSFLFKYTLPILVLMIFIGFLTAYITSLISITQYDLKKIIAYSTCSQLGFMLVICGFCGFNLSFFHLFIHGFFKAMLFLLAGTVIHFVLDEQDFRKFNNLFFFFPVTYIFFLIASLSLSGFPFSSGFYSKDLILESIFNFQYKFSNFFFFFLNILTLLSAFYSFRLIFKSFLATPIQTMYFFFSNTNSF